ncbi:uncharacterized protein LOC108049292 [Drosophila rhopaloa]|uniref:Uncharacterized protein LOC108049292 n=1 Tax=Drosophila rhopaloa TaxID=1041015 RepID=A0A6P4F6K4_DRORH|nr:uncharacterized protein LOC108049292 [Drosophila rhopaloa]
MPKPTRNASYFPSRELISSSIFPDDDQIEDLEEVSDQKSRFSLTTNLTRGQSVILDYKQFKAARTIQRFVRGWLVRHHLRNLERSAIVIQKWWRRFAAQRNLINVAEKVLQSTILAHYEWSATKIQTIYRGWWSRKHIFDLTMLKKLQNALAKDLIHTLVKYLYSTKHSDLMPGVYTIKESSVCLKTLEQLMSTFGFRYFNAQASYKMHKSLSMVAQGRQAFKIASDFTDVPYSGFNDTGFCNIRNHSVMNLNATEPEHFEFIHIFLAGHQKLDMAVNIKLDKIAAIAAEENRLRILKEKNNKKKSFLKRIFQDMQNWHHPDGEPILPRGIFRNNDLVPILYNAQKTLESFFGQLEPCVCPTAEDISYLQNI